MNAARKLSPAIPESDPLWQKFLSAPFDRNPTPEPETLGLGHVCDFLTSEEVSELLKRAADAEIAERRGDTIAFEDLLNEVDRSESTPRF
jgi:hypothetical protein